MGKTKTPKILLCGDSLTQLSFEGWGSQIAHVYQRRADVLNRGCSGYTTSFYLHLLDDVINELKDDNVGLVVLFFGANDAALKDIDPHHHVPLTEFKGNLERMIQKIRQNLHTSDNTPPKMVLIAPPPGMVPEQIPMPGASSTDIIVAGIQDIVKALNNPSPNSPLSSLYLQTVHHEQRLEYQKQRYSEKATGVLERTNTNTGNYADVCVQIATDCNVQCLNLYQLMMKQEKWDSFLCDGLHFAKPGHDFLAEQLLKAIGDNEDFKHLQVKPDPITGQYCNSGSSSYLSHRFPYHDEIDHACPEKAFAEFTNKEDSKKRKEPSS